MNRIYLLTFCIALLCHFHLSAHAQTDSSQYDLGRIKLSKNFTQSITIKGSDLEKMPFTNLTEAINVWLSGNYSNTNTLLFVIDGNFVSDVNALNIQDIEELTLIQNALIQVNGGTGQQQLVLVRTKRNHLKKSGFTISGQAAAVTPDLKINTAKQDGEKGADVNYYHQYYLSAWHNSNKLQFGLSASYQRDVSPNYKSNNYYHFNTTVPANFNLFRFYGWLSYKLDKNSSLSVGANYAPQKYRLHELASEPLGADTVDEKTKESLLNTWLRLRTDFAGNWENDFNISYTTASNRQNETVYASSPTVAPYYYSFLTEAKANMFNLVVRDHISYQKNFGGWRLAPSLNVMFRYLKADWSNFTVSNFSGSGIPSISGYLTQGEGRYFMITPAFHISYKNSFDWQAGLLYNATKDKSQTHIKRYFPFSSFTLDFLKLSNPEVQNSLKIYASISEADNVADLNYNMQNVESLLTAIRIPNTVTFINYSYTTPIQYPSYFNVTPWMGTAGATWSALHNRLQVSYNFEKRDFVAEVGFEVPGGGFLIQPYEFNTYAHRIGVTAKLIDHSNLHWLTGINFTNIKVKGIPQFGPNVTEYTTGDPDLAPSSWTGGWVNRLQYRNFFAGLDVLYHINQSTLAPGSNASNYSYDKHNLFRLQSLYAGWSFKVHHNKKLEAYATFRNLFESTESYLADTRKFYGLGARIDL